MNSGPGGFDGDSLDIYVRGHDEASPAFNAAWDAAQRAGAGIGDANAKLEQSARAAADAIAQTSAKITAEGVVVHEVTAAQQKTLDDLRARFAALGDAGSAAMAGVGSSVRGAKGELEGIALELDAMRRSLQAIKDDSRAGLISPQGRIASLEDLQTRVMGGQDRETLQSRFQARDPEGVQRYTQLVAIERELQNARKATADATKQAAAEEARAEAQATDEIVATVKTRTQELADQVRLRRMSLEEEATALERYRQQYAANADAIAIIDRRTTANQLEQMRERDRAQKERGGGASDALLNAGYMLPGPLGNAAVNLGYLGMGGPTALAVGGAAMAGIGVVAGVNTVADAAGKDQEALERLKTAIEDQGGSWKTAAGEIQAWLDLQTRTTTFGRDETLPALQALVDGGVKYGDALKIVRVAEDASAGSGKSLESVAQSLMRAWEGYPRALTQLGLATKDQIHDGMQFSDVLKLIESRFRDQATNTDGYVRSQQQLKNAVADLERQLGEGGLTSALTEATKGMTGFVQSIDGNSAGAKLGAFTKEVVGLTGAFGDLLGALHPVGDAFQQLISQEMDEWTWDLHKFADGIRGIPGALKAAADAEATYGPQAYANSFGVAPGAPSQPAPSTPPASQFSSIVERYAHQFGVGVPLANALFSQESSWNPGAVSSAGALGLGQLMPNTAHEMGVTNPLDPDQNIRGSLDYLAQMLHAFPGDVRRALTAYNAGLGNVQNYGLNARFLPGADPNYADNIMRAMGLSTYNPASTNVSSPNAVGGPRAPSPFAESLTNAQLLEDAEGGSKNAAALAEYLNQLERIKAEQESISTDGSKSNAEQATARKNVQEVEQKIAATKREQLALDTAAQRVVEQQLTLAEKKLDIAQRAQQPVDRAGSFDREIAGLRALQQQRQAANDPDSVRDVANLGHDIDEVRQHSESAWQSALSDAERYYKAGKISLDQYLASIRDLESGATVPEKATATKSAADAIEKNVTDQLKSIEDTYKDAVKRGVSRAGLEALATQDIGAIGQIRNYGDAKALGFQTNASAGMTGDRSSLYDQDAAAAVAALDEKYRELANDIAATGVSQSVKDRELAAAVAQQIVDLQKLEAQYVALEGVGGAAVTSIQAKLASLSVTEQGYLADATRATRQELQQQAEEYQKFADTASDHLAKIFLAGHKGANDFRQTFKAAIADMEQQLVSNAIEGTFFGVGSTTSPMQAFEKAFLGTAGPAQTQAQKNAAVSDAALQKIANSPTGDTNSPLTVQLTPQSTSQLTGAITGVLPGSATANNSTLPASVTGGTGSSGGVNPVLSALGLAGGAAGPLTLALAAAGLAGFGSSSTPSNQPDRTNTNAYGQTIANLTGSAGANGQNFYESPATERAFGGQSGLAGVEQLLSFGPTAFTQQTGLSAAQYAQYVQMFGISSTGSGVLNFNPNNIGIESVSGANGANGSFTYQQYAAALAAITGGMSALGSTGPINSYSFSRSYPNLNAIGSPTSSMILPTQMEGGPGYAGPNISDITSGAQQYGLVGGILGARGGSALLGSLSTAAGVIGLLLGTTTSQQLATQSTTGTPVNSNDAVLGAIGLGPAAVNTDSSSGFGLTTPANQLFSSLSLGAASTSASNGFGFTTTQQLLSALGNGTEGFSNVSYPTVSTAGGIAGGSGLDPSPLSGNSIGNSGFLGGTSSGLMKLLSGGNPFTAAAIGDALQGAGLGIGLNSLVGGNQANGSIGSVLGSTAGLFLGGPLGSLLGGAAGGLLGGLFGNHTNAATSPDIYNTNQYGTITADLVGAAGANGTQFYEDSSTYKAFNGLSGLAGVEELLAGGQSAFTEETGLSAAQYAQYVKMFGESATGSGTLDSQKNIGQKYVTGASGASGVYSYTQYGQALAAIEQGLSSSGVVGPYDSYTFSRTYPNYNAGTLAAAGNSTTNPTTTTTGSGAGSNTAATSTPTTAAAALTKLLGNNGTAAAIVAELFGGNTPGSVSPIMRSPVTLSGNVFLTSESETAAALATLLGRTQVLQAKGALPNTSANTYARVPVA